MKGHTGKRLILGILIGCLLLTGQAYAPAAARASETETSGSGTPATPKIAAPSVEITRADMDSVKGGESFQTQLTIRNRGTTALVKPVVSITASGAVHLAEKSSTMFLSDIAAGAEYSMTMKFTADATLNASSEEFQVTVKYSYDDGTGTLEANEESATITVPTTATKVTETVPVVQISRGSVSTVKANKSVTLPVTVYNAGDAEIKNAVLSVSTEEGLNLADKSTSRVLGTIAAKGKKTVKLKLKADKTLSASYLYVNCDLKYNYTSAGATLSGTESAKLSVPAAVTAAAAQTSAPLLRITKSEIKNPVKANQKFSVKVTVKNDGDTDITNASLSVDGSDELLIVDNTSSFAVAKLAAGKSTSFRIRVKALSELTIASQSLNAELKYRYKGEGGAYENGTESIRIAVPVTVTKKDETQEEQPKAATPNLIVSGFDYGGDAIANGDQFDLSLRFQNMGQIPVSNIVMTVEPEEQLAISSAANTYYYDSLGAGQTKGEKIGMYALPTAESGSAKVNITFRYEYVDNQTRNEVSNTQTVSVPLYKPDLMEFTAPDSDLMAMVGEEYPLSIEYVNKGKGEVSNVRAEIVGDIGTLQSAQNLGNFEAGKSGSINFVLIPEMAGETSFTVKITYEDANLQEKEYTMDLTMTAEEGYYDEEFTDFAEEGEETVPAKKSRLPFVLIGIVIVAAVAGVIVFRKKRKKKNTVKINWED